MGTGGVGGGSFAGLQRGVVAPVTRQSMPHENFLCGLLGIRYRTRIQTSAPNALSHGLHPTCGVEVPLGRCNNVRLALAKGHGCVGSLVRRVVFRFRLSNSTAGDAVTDVEGVRGGRLRPKTKTTDGFKDAGPCAGK